VGTIPEEPLQVYLANRLFLCRGIYNETVSVTASSRTRAGEIDGSPRP